MIQQDVIEQKVSDTLKHLQNADVIKKFGDIEAIQGPEFIEVSMVVQPAYPMQVFEVKVSLTSDQELSIEVAGQTEFQFVEAEKPWQPEIK